MHQVSSLPPCCVTSGQDSQQLGTLGLTKISQHENSTVHTNIKVVSQVMKYKQYKQTSQSFILISRTCSGIFFFISVQP